MLQIAFTFLAVGSHIPSSSIPFLLSPVPSPYALFNQFLMSSV